MILSVHVVVVKLSGSPQFLCFTNIKLHIRYSGLLKYIYIYVIILDVGVFVVRGRTIN